ncbi:MAG: starch-binding protein [Alistipes sp.]|nr:starch-binding protein [Alistipes sp.]
MKKIYSYLLAALAFVGAASCSDLPAGGDDTQLGDDVVTIIATGDTLTKTVLTDGVKTYWNAGDALAVFSGDNTVKKFETAITAPAASAAFTYAVGDFVIPTTGFIAIYPYSAASAATNDLATTMIGSLEMPATQTAVAGGFDPAAALALSLGADPEAMQFNNLCALVKFTVKKEGVQTVTLTATGGEALAGTASIFNYAMQPTLSVTTNKVSTITLNGPFEVDKTYYIAVAPATLESGASLSFDGEVALSTTEKTVFEANTIYNLGEANVEDEVVTPSYPISEWGLVGSHQGWDLGNLTTMYVIDEYQVALNFTVTESTTFKFAPVANGGSWDNVKGSPVAATTNDAIGEWSYTGSNDITVAAGSYDVYFDATNSQFAIVVAGAAVPEKPVVTTTYKLYFYNYAGWSAVNLWAWSASANYTGGTWPGILLSTTEKVGEYDYLVYEMPAAAVDQSIQCICSGDGAQTSDSEAFILNKDYYFRINATSLTMLDDPSNPLPEVVVPTTPQLYLKPNSNWLQASARFAVYYFNNSTGKNEWLSMTDEDGDGIYSCDLKDYPNVIFCRMDPGTTTNGWDTKWNQTSDLTVPTDGKNLYTVADGSWDKGGGTWSTK